MSILITSLITVWAIVAALMIFVILMQRPKSEGLGAAFGGGVTENIFGAQTTNVLVKFTTYLATIFFVITFVLSVLYAHQTTNKSVLREELLKREATSAPSASPGTAQSPAANSTAPAASAAPSATVAAAPASSASPKKP